MLGQQQQRECDADISTSGGPQLPGDQHHPGDLDQDHGDLAGHRHEHIGAERPGGGPWRRSRGSRWRRGAGRSRGSHSYPPSLPCAASAASWPRRRFDAREPTVVAMRDTLVHRGPDDAGAVVGGSRRARRARPSPAVDRRPLAGRAPADAATRTGPCGSPTTARSTTTPRCARNSRQRGTVTDRTPTPRRSSTSTRRKGRGCVERLEGMFAIAIWDARRARAVPRPRPARRSSRCYYAEPAGGFVFALGDQGAARASGRVERDLDEEAFFALPDVRLHSGAADDVQGHLQAGARRADDRPRRRLAIQRRSLLDADVGCGRATRSPAMSEEEMEERLLRAAARLDREADDVRRAVRGVPLRRRRLLDERRADGGADRPSRSGPSRSASTSHERYNELEYARADRPPIRDRSPRGADRLRRTSSRSCRRSIYHQDEPIADWVCVPLHFVSQARARHRHDRRPGRRGLGRDVPRLQEVHRRGPAPAVTWEPFQRVPAPLRRGDWRAPSTGLARRVGRGRGARASRGARPRPDACRSGVERSASRARSRSRCWRSNGRPIRTPTRSSSGSGVRPSASARTPTCCRR